MQIKHQINILFFSLYLGSLGRYFLNQIISSKLTNTYVTSIIDILIVLLTISLVRSKTKYLKYLITFISVSFLSYSFSNNSSIFSHINGIRETAVFICYFIIMDILFHSGQIKLINKRFSTFAYIFLATQIPISLIQFIRFGPGDLVGGTFEIGGSGLLSLSIFLLVFYLIEDKIKTPDERIIKGVPLIIFLIPIAFNETKISFILILLFFLSFANLNEIRSNILVSGLGIIALISFSFIYTTNENIKFNNPLEGFTSSDFLEKYLYGDVEDNPNDVPRFTKLAVMIQKLSEDSDLYFGKDYSAFMFNNKEMRSEFSRRYNWLLMGSLPYSLYLLVSGGIFLLLLVCAIIYDEILTKYKRILRFNSLPLLIFSTSIFVIILFYNDAFRSPVFSFIFVFILFYSKRYNIQ